MSTKMQAEFAGQVGVSPRLVRVSTSDTEAEIKSAGWINQYEAATGVTIAKSDVIFITWDGGDSTGIFLPEFGAGRVITLQAIAGDGGGSFPDQVNTYFVSKAGDDANTGLNPGDAKLTINGAINAIPDITVRSVIYIIDGETYVEDVQLPVNASLIIMGSNATIETVTAPISVDAGGLLVLDVYGVTGGTGAALLADGNDQIIVYAVTMTGSVQSDNGGRIDIDTEFLIGDVIADDHVSGSIDNLTGNISKSSATVADLNLDIGLLDGNIDLNSSQTTLRVGEFTGAINLTETVPGDSFFTVSIVRIGGGYGFTSTIANLPRGFIGNQVYGTYDVLNNWQSSTFSSLDGFKLSPNAINLDYTFLPEDCNKLVVVNSLSNIELYAPDAATAPGLPVGWRCFIAQLSSGNGRINVMGTDILESVSGRRWTEGRGAISQLTLIAEGGGQRVWSWGGQIAGSALAATASVYVSALTGDDATATGSQEQPFATIQAAVDYAESGGAPANPHFITVMDGETYTETVTVSQPNVNILALTAILTQTGANDTLVINTVSPNTFVGTFGGLFNTGTGYALRQLGTSSIVTNVGAAIGKMSCGDGDVSMLATANILSNIETNDGAFVYRCNTRSGTDTVTGLGNIHGIASDEVRGREWLMVNGGAIGKDGGGSQEFILWPPTASQGYTKHVAADNSGNNFLTITNNPQTSNRTARYPDYPSNWYFMGCNHFPDLGANLITVDGEVPFSALSLGASLSLMFATSGATYKIREIMLNSGGTNFSGGDRNIEVFAGANVYTVIPNATLGAMVNARWGSTEVPFPASISCNASTPASINIAVRYNGGTTDHTAGVLHITVVYERVG